MYPREVRGPDNLLELSTENQGLGALERSGSAFHSPRREAARFPGLVEEEDVAVRIAKACLAPHPGLVSRTMLECNSATRKLLHALVEVVALKVDRRRRDDLFLGIDLHRESDPAAGFEPRVPGVR